MNGSAIGGAKRGAAIGLLVGLPISALMMGTSLEVPFRLFPPAFVLFWGMFPVLFGAIGAAAGYFYHGHRMMNNGLRAIVSRLLFVGSPCVAAGITGAIALLIGSADEALPLDPCKSYLYGLNAVLAAVGSAFGGFHIRDGFFYRVTASIAGAVFGFLGYLTIVNYVSWLATMEGFHPGR